MAVIDPAAVAAESAGLFQLCHRTGISDTLTGVDVDALGNIYVTGTVLGDVFAGTGRPLQPPNSNLNVFLLVFSLT